MGRSVRRVTGSVYAAEADEKTHAVWRWGGIAATTERPTALEDGLKGIRLRAVPDSHSRKLRDKLNQALRKERRGEALSYYEALQVVEPNEPRWPHRKGDLLKRLGRRQEAVEAYERAADLYAHQGFEARAAAMAKVVMGIAPEHVDVLERVSPDAARKLHRSARPAVVTADADAEFGGDEPVTQTKRLAVDVRPTLVGRRAIRESR